MNIILVGYSGHSYVVAEILNLLNQQIVGYFDKESKVKNPFNLKYLGSETHETALNYIKEAGIKYALGIGENVLRKKVDLYLRNRSLEAVTAIHPNAAISSSAIILEAVVIACGAIINPIASIGRGAIINTSAVVEHECRVGEYVNIGPGAIVAGNVNIGECTLIGANATIKQGLRVGSNAVLGAGSVLVNDLPDNEVWVGCPAKRIK